MTNATVKSNHTNKAYLMSVSKKLFLLILLFSVHFVALAQDSFRDVVYLNDGSKVKGKVLGFDSLERLKVQTYNDYFLVFRKAEVRKFIINGNQEAGLTSENKPASRRGFINITQLGLLTGREPATATWWNASNGQAFANLSLESYNGYRFNPYWSLGAVTGIDDYEEGALFPLGLGTYFSPLNKKISPTIFLSSGHSFSFYSKKDNNLEYKGGWYWHTGLGVRVRNSGNTAFVVNVGYQSQQSSLRISQGIWEGRENFTFQERTYKRISVMLGFSF